MGAYLLLILAFAASAFSPLLTTLVGLFIFGVPHVLADVRYLIMRPQIYRRVGLIAAASIPLVLAALRFGMIWVVLLGCVPLLLARGESWKRFMGLIFLAPLFALSWRYGTLASIAFVFLHNVVALVMWWVWRTRRSFTELVFPLLFFIGAALMLIGLADPVLRHAWPLMLLGRSAADFGQSLAPLADPVTVYRWAAVFAFAQSMHYIVWLHLIPGDAEPGASIDERRNSLVKDCGWPLIILTILVGLSLMFYGTRDPWAARDLYLRLAGFHGIVEIFFLSLLFMEGRKILV